MPAVPPAAALKTLRFRSSLEKVPSSRSSYVTEVPAPAEATEFKVIVPLVVLLFAASSALTTASVDVPVRTSTPPFRYTAAPESSVSPVAAKVLFVLSDAALVVPVTVPAGV